MVISSQHLKRMGATPEIIATYRRLPLLIQWTRSGYLMEGVISARNLSAAEVLRYIQAAADYKA